MELALCLCLVTQSCPTLCDPIDCSLPGSSVHGDSPGKNIGVGCHALLQGIFPTQGSNPDLPLCRWILYHLSHQGSSRILEWVAYPFSRGSSWSRNQTRVFCIAGGFFTSWTTRKTLELALSDIFFFIVYCIQNTHYTSTIIKRLGYRNKFRHTNQWNPIYPQCWSYYIFETNTDKEGISKKEEEKG